MEPGAGKNERHAAHVSAQIGRLVSDHQAPAKSGAFQYFWDFRAFYSGLVFGFALADYWRPTNVSFFLFWLFSFCKFVFRLWRLHSNVSRSLGRLAPFIFNEWFFDNSNTRNLQKSLSETDKYVLVK